MWFVEFYFWYYRVELRRVGLKLRDNKVVISMWSFIYEGWISYLVIGNESEFGKRRGAFFF